MIQQVQLVVRDKNDFNHFTIENNNHQAKSVLVHIFLEEVMPTESTTECKNENRKRDSVTCSLYVLVCLKIRYTCLWTTNSKILRDNCIVMIAGIVVCEEYKIQLFPYVFKGKKPLIEAVKGIRM